MDRQNLYAVAVGLTERVVTDPRWQKENDEIGLNVFGMLLYGFAMGVGRLVMILEMEDVDSVVELCLTRRVGVNPKWSSGMVAEAKRSAFNQEHHLIHYELISIGHSYGSIQDQAAVVDNVFANIASIRKRMNEESANTDKSN